ncbi:hypothetical protein ABMA32_13450 [Mesorhizobium sp. VNQ89]|uniref:hypothetical protein n=1 Tax=Mesorhizobium quangtriensis TaxID=3157709 RepID=UPI0032B81A00
MGGIQGNNPHIIVSRWNPLAYTAFSPPRGAVVSSPEVTAMEHIAALLLIVACSDDMAQCRELETASAVYETQEECDVDLQPTISRFVTRYPQVLGQCVSVDPAIEEEDADLVWNVKPDGTLFAMIEVPEFMIASGPEARKNQYLRHE